MPKSSQSAEGTPGIQTPGTDARAENCPQVSPPPCPSSSVVLWPAELLPTQSSLHPTGSTTPFTGTGPHPHPESAGRQGGREESGATGVSQQTGSRKGAVAGPPPSSRESHHLTAPAPSGEGAPASQTPPGVSEPQTPPPHTLSAEAAGRGDLCPSTSKPAERQLAGGTRDLPALPGPGPA